MKEKSITGHMDLELYSVHSRSGHVQVPVKSCIAQIVEPPAQVQLALYTLLLNFALYHQQFAYIKQNIMCSLAQSWKTINALNTGCNNKR